MENNQANIPTTVDSIPLDTGGEDDVLAVLATYFGFSKREIESPTRRQDIVRARHMIMYLLREYGGMSFPAIGRLIGDRDHTTVMHGCNKVKENFQKSSEQLPDLDGPMTLVTALKERRLQVAEELKRLNEQIQLETKAGTRLAVVREIPERSLKVLEMYREGLSLKNMSDIFNLSRERVRQIVFGTIRQMAINESLTKGIIMDADILIEEELKNREAVRESKKPVKVKKEKRWSEYYVECRSCHTTAFPHVRHGLCEQCSGSYRGERREAIITRHLNQCDVCKISRPEAIKKYGRDFYITKSQEVLCQKHFRQMTGQRLGKRIRKKKVQRV